MHVYQSIHCYSDVHNFRLCTGILTCNALVSPFVCSRVPRAITLYQNLQHLQAPYRRIFKHSSMIWFEYCPQSYTRMHAKLVITHVGSMEVHDTHLHKQCWLAVNTSRFPCFVSSVNQPTTQNNKLGAATTKLVRDCLHMSPLQIISSFHFCWRCNYEYIQIGAHHHLLTRSIIDRSLHPLCGRLRRHRVCHSENTARLASWRRNKNGKRQVVNLTLFSRKCAHWKMRKMSSSVKSPRLKTNNRSCSSTKTI